MRSTAFVVVVYWFAALFVPAGHGQTDPVSALIEQLHDPDPQVRWRAAEGLANSAVDGRLRGRFADTRPIEPLIATLKDPNSGVRQQAVYALANIGPPAVEPLIAMLKDSDSQLRAQAATALGEIRDRRSVEPLIAALSDSDSKVIDQAVFALAQIKDSRAIEPLIVKLGDADPDVQQMASGALANMEGPATEPLIAALRNPDPLVRKYAANALSDYKDARAADALLAGLREGDAAVVAGGFRFFLRQPESGSENVLVRALNEYGGIYMAQALLSFGNPHLQAAVRNWADEHGYRIAKTPSGAILMPSK